MKSLKNNNSGKIKIIRKKKSIRPLILTLIFLLMPALTSCGMHTLQSSGDSSDQSAGSQTADSMDSTDNTDTITITFFDKNSGSAAFTDSVAQKIMEATGVQIEVVDPTSEPSERLEVMLSNRDYPDMVLMGQGEIVNRYIESGALIQLDDLIGQYGTNIREMYGDTLDKCRYTDGHIYWLANWYGPDTDASAGVLMRRDLLAEIVGEERAESNEPFTQSEYTQILKEFKEKFPELNGHETIALELDNDAENFYGTMRGMYGLKSYGTDEDNNIYYLPATETYENALLYLNQLYREGLLDKEWVIDKTARWEKKLSSGYVFSTWCAYWDVSSVNEELAETLGDEAQFYCYKVVADGLTADQTTYNGRNGLGWDAIGITDNCTNPEAAIRVADYLASEEGQYLMLWGVEGETWEYENGIHVPMEDFLSSWTVNETQIKKETGVRRWTWFIKNGNGSDGSPYDMTTKYVPDEKTAFANASFGASDYWDTSELSGLEPSGTMEAGLKWLKVSDLYQEYGPKIISSSTAEEAERQYRKMKTSMEENGLAEIEEYMSEQYKIRRENWGLD